MSYNSTSARLRLRQGNPFPATESVHCVYHTLPASAGQKSLRRRQLVDQRSTNPEVAHSGQNAGIQETSFSGR